MPLQDQLRDFFTLDSRARGMRTRLDAATRRRDAQQHKLDQLRQQSAELTDQLKHTQAHAATLERESQGAEQRVAQLRERMNAVTSNKEYAALLVEVNTLKEAQSKLEDQALEQITRVEQLTARVQELADKIAQQEKIVTAADADVTAAREAVGQQLDEATALRDTAAAQVPEDVLAIFNRLAEAYDGEALADIEEQNRRRMEYTCGGCFIHIPVEKLNALITRPDDLITCPNCKRILCVTEDLKTTLAPK